jgi:hypothetical protein
MKTGCGRLCGCRIEERRGRKRGWSDVCCFGEDEGEGGGRNEEEEENDVFEIVE